MIMVGLMFNLKHGYNDVCEAIFAPACICERVPECVRLRKCADKLHALDFFLLSIFDVFYNECMHLFRIRILVVDLMLSNVYRA